MTMNGKIENKAPSALRELLGLLLKITIVVVAFVLLFTFLFGLTRYQDSYMAPAMLDGDLVVSYRLESSFAAGDLVLLSYEGKTQIRRVVAVAGDTVDINENGLLINGALQQEKVAGQKTERYAEGIAFPVTLTAGEVFVLADTRQGAADSRLYGPVHIGDLRGVALAMFRWRGM